ncbi:MAG: DNA polymerase III subunit gamma/tau [Methylococcales bacterium]|jgi:DNA polymerase III subunit gamma/tau|nr:DNA polymerase III subunit gamma/tau [Methylococcales bacterium]MBT7444858.1 DNA polymerase III subunit gamma/tau [Methylococcales bacterium]
MGYQVLARKWRPHSFKEMVGQEHVVRALVNGLESQRLHHAYLFTGTRGVGKTTIARILSKSLNCISGISAEPCGVCDVCVAVNDGRFVDLIEVDAASRTKVEDTRELLENVHFAPTMGRYKVYLIDEVHMLSTHSFNALLKTLEEPPEHVKFLLATTDPQKLPITVLSRCLQFNLKRLTPEQIMPQLSFVLGQEEIAFEEKALKRLANAADGSMRDALSLLDQAIAYGSDKVLEQGVREMLGAIEQQHIANLLKALLAQDALLIMGIIKDLFEQSADFKTVLQEVLVWLHHLAVLQIIPNIDDPRFDQAFFHEYSGQIPAEDLQLYYQIGLLGQKDLSLSADPRIGFEMVMLRMLAFKPVQGDTQVDVQPASIAQPVAAKMHAPSAAPPAKAAPRPAVQQVSPTSSAAVPTQAAEPVAAVSNAAHGNGRDTIANNWDAAVNQLPLKAMAKELANNCVFVSWQGDSLNLSIEPEREHLCTALLEDRLQASVSEYIGAKVALKIAVKQAEQETPAQKKLRLTAELQGSAEQSIDRDEVVQAIKSEFGAEVVPDSVKPHINT